MNAILAVKLGSYKTYKQIL